MASPKKDLLGFENAIEYMDPMQVTEYLQKTLDFLNRNNTELCFPNISSYTEAFLVRLVSETKNLKSKSLNSDNEKLAADIIDVLEMNRDVFRWTYGYVPVKQNKDLLMYKKIFSNKLKMKPTDIKLPTRKDTILYCSHPLDSRYLHQIKTIRLCLDHYELFSTISQRLVMAQTSKIQLLNMTLRFIKDTSESTLYYPEMPLTQAQYIHSLLSTPKSDLNVGFGYKSLCAPLFEALDVHGLDTVFEVSFVETDKCDTASLKLEKRPRKKTKDTSKEEVSTNISTSSTKKSSSTNKREPVGALKNSFINKTLNRLIDFTEDPDMDSVTFQEMNDDQLAFIKGLKTLAGNPASYGTLDERFGAFLRKLNDNIIEVMKTSRLRVEEGVTKKNVRFITVKKVPKDAVLPTLAPKRAGPVARSQSVPSENLRDRSLSKERRIHFESAGKDPSLTKDNTPRATEPETVPPKTIDKKAIDNKKERGRSKDRLNDRKAKLLEDMSVPLESDRGIRMMLLMGWNGGALGARGEGILEPIVPAIDVPPGAGLGHVPPPKPEAGRASPDFRGSLLQYIQEMFHRNLDTKVIDYKTPLTNQERSFISSVLKNLNKRTMLGLGVKAEAETFRQIMRVMIADVQIVLAHGLDKEHKIVTLTKSRNATKTNLSKVVSRLNQRNILDEPLNMTVLNTNLEYEVIGEEMVKIVIKNIIPKLDTPCKTPVAIKTRATRILVLQRFANMVKSATMEKEFRIQVGLVKRIDPFVKDVISGVNAGQRSTHVTAEEMLFYDHLARCSDQWTLSLCIMPASRFILSKKLRLPNNQTKCNNSPWAQPDNNNDAQTNNQNETIIISDDEEENVLTIVVKEQERMVKLEKVAKTETECDVGNKDNEANAKEVKIDLTKDVEIDIKNKHEGIDRENKNVGSDLKNKAEENSLSNKDEGIDMKTKDIGIDIKNKDEGIGLKTKDQGIVLKNKAKGIDLKDKDVVVDSKNKYEGMDIKNEDDRIDLKNKDVGNNKKRETETDDELSDSLCVCDTNVDICDIDKDIQDLEKAIFEADLDIEIKREKSTVSPINKRSRTNSINSLELSTKRCKITDSNCLIISPNDPDQKINTEHVKLIQTRICAEFDKSRHFLPLLKCHGIQKEGLIYSCQDENDKDWLKNVINGVNLDLKVCISDDFCIEQKNRKMAIKINSFVPIECKKLFKTIEAYNEGLKTAHWKVLGEQTYESFVFLIVEVDDSSFKYISKENFALYAGVDQAQFSVIY